MQGQDEVTDTAHELHWTMLSPTSAFRVRWDITVLVLLLYYVFAVPFRLCFLDTQKPARSVCRNDFHMQSMSTCLESRGCQWLPDQTCDQEDVDMGLFLFDTVVDFFFLVDICLNFRTAFTVIDDRATQHLVTNSKAIALKYMRTWFLFDLAGSIPLDLILFILAMDDSAFASTQMAARLPRFFRIAKILRFLKLARAARIGKVIDRIQEDANIKPGVLRVVKLSFYFVVVAHFMACFLFWLGTMDEDFVCYEESLLCPAEDVVPMDFPEGAPVVGISWLTQTRIVSRCLQRSCVDVFCVRVCLVASYFFGMQTIISVLIPVCRCMRNLIFDCPCLSLLCVSRYF